MADVFTQAGEEWAVDKLQDETNSIPTAKYIAWGSGSGTPSKSDTALFNEETAEGRALATLSQPSPDIYRAQATITAAGSKTITEFGLFTASTGGTLVEHSTMTGVPVQTGDQIQFTIDMELT